MEGKTARGASSPANPALHIPEPLSTTSAAISSSMAELRRATEGRNPLTLKSFESTSSHQRLSLAELSLPVHELRQFARSAARWSARPALRTGPDKRKWRCILSLPYKDMVGFRAALRLPAPWRAARATRGHIQKEQTTLQPSDHSLLFR